MKHQKYHQEPLKYRLTNTTLVQAGSIFRSSECYSETRDRGTERQGLVYSAQWRNPYNLGTNLGYQSAVNYQLIVIKETKGYVCDETRQIIEASP